MVLAVYAHWVCDCIMLGQSSVSQVYCRIFKVKNNDKGQIRLTFYRMNVRIVLNYGVNIYMCNIYIYIAICLHLSNDTVIHCSLKNQSRQVRHKIWRSFFVKDVCIYIFLKTQQWMKKDRGFIIFQHILGNLSLIEWIIQTVNKNKKTKLAQNNHNVWFSVQTCEWFLTWIWNS